MRVKERRAPILRRYAFWAPRYDRFWGRYSDTTLSRAVAIVAERAPSPARILDVACGTGLFAERLLAHFPRAQVVGVDLSPDMLEQARARFNGDRRVTLIQSSAERLPVEAESFDIVTCNNAFHLIPDHMAALAEFRRALTPGGTLVVIDWDRHAPSIKLVNFNYTVFGRHPRHIMNAEELSESIHFAGFEILHTDRFAATWFWKMAAVVARKTP